MGKSGKCVLVFAFLVAVLVSELSSARSLHANNENIHKFFDNDDEDDDDDDDDDLFDLFDDKGQALMSSAVTPKHQVTSLLSVTANPGTDLTSSSDDNSISDDYSISESFKNLTSSGLFDGRNSSNDLCTGIRCRVGRVCQVDGESGVAWCVCAKSGHCVDHGRRVCGSDGHFYFSHCELHRMACTKNLRIRANHDERSCVHHLLTTEAKGSKDSAEIKEGTTDSLLPEFTDVNDSQPLIPSSTQQTAMDNRQSALRPVPELMPRDCMAGEYERLLEELLRQYCTGTGKPKCAQTDNWNKNNAKAVFSYYDRNLDQLLDQLELDSMELDLAESRDQDVLAELYDSCLLRDVVKLYDKTDGMALNLSEFLALLGVELLGSEDLMKVSRVSATVGTSLELKCDVAGMTDCTWKRNGDLLTELSDNRIKVKVFEDGSLYIGEVFLYHVGNYTCHEKGSSRIISSHLVSAYVPPIVRVSPKFRFLVPGSTVTIDCYAEGIPLPDVSWTVNDVPLPEKPDHYSLMHDGLSLQIRDADYSVDTGTFKCQANNFVGISEDVATIFIENDNSFQGTYSDESYELFVVFHAEGYTVYESGRCHMHHVILGDYKIEPRDVGGSVETLCDSNSTCEWGAAVNVKNTFVYVSQPNLNRIVVIELLDRFNPAEIIAVDENPLEVVYIEHLDQVWVSCHAEDFDNANVLKTPMIIQRASADVRHNVIHTRPIMDQFDKVKSLFLPPSNAFKQTFDYGFVIRGDRPTLHKIDLNTMVYVKDLGFKYDGNCAVNQMTFVPMAGKIFLSCKEFDSDGRNNMTSLCFSIDYITDKVANATISCGDLFITPNSRHLLVVSDDRHSVLVYHVQDDGTIELVFDKTIDFCIGEVAFTASERGYGLFANSPDKLDILYMNLASGYTEIMKGIAGSSSSPDCKAPKIKRRQPIVSGGIFSDYILTTTPDTVRVIDTKRRHVQCEWQNIKMATAVAWIEAGDH